MPFLSLCLEPSSQIKEGDVAPGETEARGGVLGGPIVSLAGALAEQPGWFWGGLGIYTLTTTTEGGFGVVWVPHPLP